MSQPTGVLALQGDFAKHLEALDALGAPGLEVRSPEDLAKVDRLIIPGGESTTVGMLLDRYGLGSAIREKAAQGMPIWGTCMGMILLASRVQGRSPYRLELLDIAVERNAFGAQVHSFEAEVPVSFLSEPVLGVFIRAPIVTEIGAGVEVVSEFDGKVVGVRRGSVLATSYHPELTDDRRLHAWFCGV